LKYMPYLLLILGIVCTAIGFLWLAGYGAILYAAPLFKDVLDITFETSKWMLLITIFTISSGICLSFYIVSKATEGNYTLFLSSAVICSGFSLSLQLFRMIVNGFSWVGIELLGEAGRVRIMTAASAGILLFTCFFFVTTLAVLREEFIKR